MITKLRILGMSCNNCVRHVDKALREVPGVERVEVSLPDGAATVTYDGALDVRSLVAAVESAGYDAAVTEA